MMLLSLVVRKESVGLGEDAGVSLVVLALASEGAVRVETCWRLGR